MGSSEELSKRIPEFLGPVEDVTGKPNYSMFNLSLRDEWGITNQFCVNIAVEEEEAMSGSCPEQMNHMQKNCNELQKESNNFHKAKIPPNASTGNLEVNRHTNGVLGVERLNRVSESLTDLTDKNEPKLNGKAEAIAALKPTILKANPSKVVNGFNAPEQ